MLEVNINGIATRVLIDSASVSNLIRMEEYEELKAQGLNAKMRIATSGGMHTAGRSWK